MKEYRKIIMANFIWPVTLSNNGRENPSQPALVARGLICGMQVAEGGLELSGEMG
jgi:hypothetical protein